MHYVSTVSGKALLHRSSSSISVHRLKDVSAYPVFCYHSIGIPWLAGSCPYADADLALNNENGSRGTMLARVAMQSCYERLTKIPQLFWHVVGGTVRGAKNMHLRVSRYVLCILVADQSWYRHSANRLAHGEYR